MTALVVRLQSRWWRITEEMSHWNWELIGVLLALIAFWCWVGSLIYSGVKG